MSQEVKLTRKQQAFINEYLQCWNATEAAKRAGYSENSAYSIGHENLSKPEIAAAIKVRVDALTMSADEALLRLTEHARGDLSEFIGLDVQQIAEHPRARLIKKYKRTVRTGKDDYCEERVELELYDAQVATIHILKERHLMAGEATERSEVTDTTFDDEERLRRIAALLERARTRRDGQASTGDSREA